MERPGGGMVPILATALAAGLMAGCRSFEKDWSEVRRGSFPPDPRGISGAWTGTWQNTNNTHGGPLRAVLWRVEEREYRARFHAVWGHRSGSFSTTLRGGWTNDVFVFEGRRRILGVPIRTTGRATATNLDSGYDSPLDRGTFTLGRRASD